MFDRALETLERYSPDAFHSLYLPAYVISALCKNLDQVEEIMCCPEEEEAEKREEERNLKSNSYFDGEMSDWDEAAFDYPHLGQPSSQKDGPREEKEEEQEQEKDERREKDQEPEPEPEKQKKKNKPKDCRQNHRQRVALLRQKYNLTFI